MENNGIMSTKSWVSNNTLDRYSWSTLDWYLSWHLIDTPSTSRLTISWESAYFQLMHTRDGQDLTDYQPAVDWVSIKHRPSVNRDVDLVSNKMPITGIESINKHSTLGCFSTHGPNNDPNNKYLISHSPLELDQCTQTMINKCSSNSVKNHNWQEAEK